jgi:preprotein translocase subunit YajC
VLFSLLLQQESPYLQLPIFLAIGLVFYLLLYLPMQRQKKKQAEMLRNLKSGDVVTTTGGIVGTIVSAEEDTIVLRVKPDNLKLQFSRASVGTLVLPEDKSIAKK